jgi:hypothetical protein
MNRRKYKIGDGVIWTDYADGKPYRATITGPGEPRRHDDDIPLSVTVPLWLIRIDGDKWDTEVSEDCLSSPPPASLQAVPGPDDDG